jgi:hypothetical protein
MNNSNDYPDEPHPDHEPGEIRPRDEPFPHFYDIVAHMQHDNWNFHVPEGVFFVSMCRGNYYCQFLSADSLSRAYHERNNDPIDESETKYVGAATTPLDVRAMMNAFIANGGDHFRPLRKPSDMN